MVQITFAPGDATLANRLQNDLSQAPDLRGTDSMLVALISPAANADSSVQQAIITALDNNQHIIPIIAQPTPLPKLINHLQALDFSAKYDSDLLIERLQALSAPDAPSPMRVLTPKTRTANRRFGYIFAALAVMWFVIGILLIGGHAVEFPRDEYNQVETQIVMTRDYFLDQNQPRTTEQATSFPVTLRAAPTYQRPFLIATATAQAEGK
jgi:hypothetical protein